MLTRAARRGAQRTRTHLIWNLVNLLRDPRLTRDKPRDLLEQKRSLCFTQANRTNRHADTCPRALW